MPHPLALHHAQYAERCRAQLADFWGRPIRGLPRGMDLLQAMHITATSTDLVDNPEILSLYLTMCHNFAQAYRTSDVWVAPHSMAPQIAQHPLVNNASVIVGNLEDAAPARDGLVYFPTPIKLGGTHPIHGIAWHMEGADDDLAFAVETITTTRLLPTRLPRLLADSLSRCLPRSPLSPNGVTTLYEGILSGYSNPDLWGAPDKATALALVLAFWELRQPDDHDPSEDTLTVPQHNGGGTKNTGRNPKNKRSSRPTRRRRIRIIREPVHAPDRNDPNRPASEGGSGPKWKDDTLRWEVSKKSQNRCPNPHQHRAIIEAGGECKPIRVPVKAHINGPKGRRVDPRRAVRVVPDRPPRDRP